MASPLSQLVVDLNADLSIVVVAVERADSVEKVTVDEEDSVERAVVDEEGSVAMEKGVVGIAATERDAVDIVAMAKGVEDIAEKAADIVEKVAGTVGRVVKVVDTVAAAEVDIVVEMEKADVDAEGIVEGEKGAAEVVTATAAPLETQHPPQRLPHLSKT